MTAIRKKIIVNKHSTNSFLLSTVIICLVITYGLSSYGIYYSLDTYVEGLYGLTSMQASFTRLASFLSYGASTLLFVNAVLHKFWGSKYAIPYCGMLICLIINIFFVTKDAFTFLCSPAMWADRLSLITVLACSLFFYTEQEQYWNSIVKTLRFLLAIIAPLLILFMLTQKGIYTDRIEAYKWLHGFGILVRLCPFLVFSIAETKKEKIIGVLLVVCDIIMLIVLQTRLYIIDIVLYLIFALFLSRKNPRNIVQTKKTKKIRVLIQIILFVILIIVAIIFGIQEGLIMLPKGGLNDAINLFSKRLYSDTRTTQAKFFFTYFGDSLPFGIGYNIGNCYSGTGPQGIDCGYLNTIYIAGIPMVFFWAMMMIVPVVKALFHTKLENSDIIIVARACAWSLIFFSSSTLSFGIEFIFFVICAGRCACLNSERG